MTLGDIIEKLLGLFGVAPGPQRKLSGKIGVVSQKIAEMEEARNAIIRTNTAIGERIADLKRQLQVETNPHNQDLLMDRIEESEKELDRKQELSRQMGENITAQRAIRARCEQLLEQLRHGADPAEIEMLMERVEDMNDMREEVGAKVDALDSVGRKPRTERSAKKEDAARAARRAAMLGTAATSPETGRARSPSAPKATPASVAPATPEPSSAPAESVPAAETPVVG